MLKQTLLLPATLLLIASVIMGQAGDPATKTTYPDDPKTWKSYTVKGEEFAIALPTRPAMASAQTADQKTRIKRVLNTAFGGVTYSIEIHENVEPNQSLDDFIAKDVAPHADVPTAKEIAVDGIAGKEFSSRNASSPAVVQFFATKQRLYRFAATGAGSDHPGVQRFFSSVTLKKDNDALRVTDGPGTPLEIDGERIYTSKELDVKPRLLAKPEPMYPPGGKGTSGTVVLQALFSGTGKVVNISVISGLPNGLTETAIIAAEKIKFTPGMKNGKPVSMWMRLEYNFIP